MRLSTARISVHACWTRWPGQAACLGSQSLLFNFRNCVIMNFIDVGKLAQCSSSAPHQIGVLPSIGQQGISQHWRCFRGHGEVSSCVENCCTSSCRCLLPG